MDKYTLRKTHDLGGLQVIGGQVGETVLLGQVRKKRRVTQEELAERVGIKLNYLKKIESGASYPSEDTRKAIRQALSYCWVCDEHGKKHKLPDLPPDTELYVKPQRIDRESA